MDKLKSEQRSALMSRVKSRGNKTTESRMISAFRKVGVKGWTRHLKVGSCRPDFVFRSERVAVFLDGCFWHMCPVHGSIPIANRDFWERKFKSNIERDSRNNRELFRLGWSVMRFWEHSIGNDSEGCAHMVAEVVNFKRAVDQI